MNTATDTVKGARPARRGISLPVQMLIGLAIGCAGLLRAKARRDPAMADAASHGMDTAFTAMLGLSGLSGLALLALRATPAMGVLLAIHLGIVLALFLTLPYGKFVHGLYRFAALLRYAQERSEA